MRTITCVVITVLVVILMSPFVTFAGLAFSADSKSAYLHKLSFRIKTGWMLQEKF